MDRRFIRILQKDIVTKPEEWRNAGPSKFIKLPDRAKNVYCVLSVIAFSSAGNAKDKWVAKGKKLGKDWFWTYHGLLQQLTGLGQKTVQRGIKELVDAGFIDYHASKAKGHKCCFRLTRVKYNVASEEETSRRNSRIWTIYKAGKEDLLTKEEMKIVREKERNMPKPSMPKEPLDPTYPWG